MQIKTKKTFKVLLLNSGYFKGHNGSIKEYILKAYRYFYCPEEAESKLINKFKKLVATEKPDLICLVEIKKGEQIKKLTNNEYSFYKIDAKYGPKSFLNKLPLFKENANSFISNHKLEFKKHYLKNGTKKLLYEIKIPKTATLFLTHFSLSKEVRTKQFKEIKKLAKQHRKVIICGDFNVFNGNIELKNLIRNLNLKIANKNPTFPAFKPSKLLDIFLCSRRMRAKSKVVKTRISDHLPVVLEIIN